MKSTTCVLGIWALSSASCWVAVAAFSTPKRLVQPQSPSATARLAVNGDSTNGAVTTTASTETFEALGLPARPGRPLRVAVAGGGVGGLTAALCMLQAGFDVTVYEKTAAFARFGGPIQFASNALSVLKAIDDTLFERIMDKFTFTGTRTCGIKDGLRADGSFRMTGDSLDYLVNKDAPADWFVKFPLKQCADLFGLPYTGVIDRPDLQEILIDECQKIKPDFIQNGNSVVSYQNLGKGNGVELTLGDGTVKSADVLVGSDGIWSAIRAQMYNEGPVKQSSPDKKTRQGCPYSGYTVFAGAYMHTSSSSVPIGAKVPINLSHPLVPRSPVLRR
jgi:zeaxanthin epoxidase